MSSQLLLDSFDSSSPPPAFRNLSASINVPSMGGGTGGIGQPSSMASMVNGGGLPSPPFSSNHDGLNTINNNNNNNNHLLSKSWCVNGSSSGGGASGFNHFPNHYDHRSPWFGAGAANSNMQATLKQTMMDLDGNSSSGGGSGFYEQGSQNLVKNEQLDHLDAVKMGRQFSAPVFNHSLSSSSSSSLLTSPVPHSLPPPPAYPSSTVLPQHPSQFSSRHEWPPMMNNSTSNFSHQHHSMAARDHFFNSRPQPSNLANFRGFTSCDEATLRRQLQQANGGFSGPLFNNGGGNSGDSLQQQQQTQNTDGTNQQQQHHRMAAMLGNAGVYLQNNGGPQQQQQTIAGDCSSASSASSVAGSADNPFLQCNTTSASVAATTEVPSSVAAAAANGNNDLDQFIQELCQTTAEDTSSTG